MCLVRLSNLLRFQVFLVRVFASTAIEGCPEDSYRLTGCRRRAPKGIERCRLKARERLPTRIHIDQIGRETPVDLENTGENTMIMGQAGKINTRTKTSIDLSPTNNHEITTE